MVFFFLLLPHNVILYTLFVYVSLLDILMIIWYTQPSRKKTSARASNPNNYAEDPNSNIFYVAHSPATSEPYHPHHPHCSRMPKSLKCFSGARIQQENKIEKKKKLLD